MNWERKLLVSPKKKCNKGEILFWLLEQTCCQQLYIFSDWNKILLSREKSYLSLARNIIDSVHAPVLENKDIAFNTKREKWTYINTLLQQYPVLAGQNLNWLLELLQEASDDERYSDRIREKPGDPSSRTSSSR